MAITVQEKTDSLPLEQGVRDGYVEARMVRKFTIQGAGNDPNQSAVSNLGPLINMGYFAQSSQTLTTALTSGGTYTAIGIAGSTVKVLSGSSVTIGAVGASQVVTLAADVNVGDFAMLTTGFTAARAYPKYTPVTPGSTAPTNAQDIYCVHRKLTPRAGADTTNNPIIDLECEYGPAWRLAPSDISQPVWSYEIQTENVHIQTAISSVDYSATTVDTGLAIGVQSDGSIQGVDILAPKSVIKARVKQRSFSASYQDTLEALVGTTNNASFNGYATGRLLFLGCVANQRGQGFYECEYTWLKQPASVSINFNIDGLSGATPVTKTAHSYLWLRSGPKQASGTVTTVTKDVHVATVYAPGDYSGINFNQ